MQLLKKTATYGLLVLELLVLGVLFGLTVSACSTTTKKLLASQSEGAHIPNVRALAEQGDMLSQYSLGSKYDRGDGIQQNHSNTMKWDEKTEEQEFTPAQAKVGVIYENGKEVHQDYKKSLGWLEKAANQGDASTQLILYRLGLGVPENEAQAKDWLREACQSGNQNGCDQYQLLNQK